MPEPVVLSIIASTIAVVTLAYKSTKTLVEFIDSLQGAPKLIKDVKGDVKAVQHILKSIELLLEPRSETNASTDLQDCLNSARVPIQDCDNACTEFAKDLKEWFRHNLSDKLTTNFKETKIANFRMRLRDTRGTLDLALNVCSIKFNGLRADQAKEFEVEMVKQAHLISGKLQGMEISRHEILDVAETLSEQNHQLSLQQGQLANRLVQHERILREALKICNSGLREAEPRSVNRVTLVKTMEEAKQVIAVLGDVTGDIPSSIEIGEMIAQGKSRQVGVTNNPEFALEFLK